MTDGVFEIGKMLERAVIANSVVSVMNHWPQTRTRVHPRFEIELSVSAVTGNARCYRRIYQMRASRSGAGAGGSIPSSAERPAPWRCRELPATSLPETSATSNAPAAFESLIQRIKRIDWAAFVRYLAMNQRSRRWTAWDGSSAELGPLLATLNEMLDLHILIADCFSQSSGAHRAVLAAEVAGTVRPSGLSHGFDITHTTRYRTRIRPRRLTGRRAHPPTLASQTVVSHCVRIDPT
jgi:hypothetical protein